MQDTDTDLFFSHFCENGIWDGTFLLSQQANVLAKHTFVGHQRAVVKVVLQWKNGFS